MTSASVSNEVLAELARIDLTSTDLEGVLAVIVDVAARAIPHADEISVTLLRDGKLVPPVTTGKLALRLDEEQYRLGHGPCLDAAASAGVLVVDDMRAETRWPDYTPRAADAGVLSSISVGLPVQHELTGALNVYAVEPGVLDYETTQLAVWFGGYAAVAVANAVRFADAERLVHQMREAMTSRAVIEQAKGVLMAVHGCDEDAAFGRLTRASQRANRKLREIATEIVASVGRR